MYSSIVLVFGLQSIGRWPIVFPLNICKIKKCLHRVGSLGVEKWNKNKVIMNSNEIGYDCFNSKYFHICYLNAKGLNRNPFEKRHSAMPYFMFMFQKFFFQKNKTISISKSQNYFNTYSKPKQMLYFLFICICLWFWVFISFSSQFVVICDV